MFDFPNPVNEKAARTVAAGVVVLCVLTIVLAAALTWSWLWLTAPLALGFLLRVAGGPRYSPLGRLGAQVIAPRLGAPRLVPGPPKRFAQAIGATLSLAAVACTAAGVHTAAIVLLALITVAAGLESGLGICLGCTVFARLMRWGVIPDTVCAECADVSARLARA